MQPQSQNIDISQIVTYLRATTSQNTSERLPAENAINNLHTYPGYALYLLQILSIEIEPNVKLAAAINLKNYINKVWDEEAENHFVISDNEKYSIKEGLVSFIVNKDYTANTSNIDNFVITSIGQIAKVDFPDNWSNLLPFLINGLDGQFNANTVNKTISILQILENIFEKYRYEFKSEPLFKEIKYVHDTYFEIWLKNITQFYQFMMSNPNMDLSLFIRILHLQTEIFYSLCFQDIPEFVQDESKQIFPLLHTIINYNLNSKDNASSIFKLKSSIIEIVILFCEKYFTEFHEFFKPFLDSMWNLLTLLQNINLDNCEHECDELVTSCLKLLNWTVQQDAYREYFSNMELLNQIVNFIIIPNISLRQNDIDEFDGNPEEWVRCDIEGSDVDTRRRMTIDLIHGIFKNFGDQITQILLSVSNSMFEKYNSNPQQFWVEKDAALYLVLALSALGSTEARGVIRINEKVNILDIFRIHILPELQRDDLTILPILKADALKFCALFREFLPTDSGNTLLPLFAKHLSSQDYVIHTYAAHAIERLISVKDTAPLPTGTHFRYSPESLKPFVSSLFTSLFNVLLTMSESQENEYIMKAIMRLCFVAKAEAISPFLETLLSQFITILGKVSKNPLHPKFNHYVFESIAVLIKHFCTKGSSLCDDFERKLWPPFQEMLSLETCVEFQQYIFQIFSQILSQKGSLSPLFVFLLPNCLKPLLYSIPSNHPSLMRLLQTYVEISPNHFIENGLIDQLLGCWNKVLFTKSNDSYAMDLLNTIFTYMPLDKISKYQSHIFQLLLTKLQKAQKLAPFKSHLLIHLCLVIHLQGFQYIYSLLESFQNGIFGYLISEIFLVRATTIKQPFYRKIVAIGISDLICTENGLMKIPSLQSSWLNIVKILIDLFEAPQESLSTAIDESTEESTEFGGGYSGGGFSKLAYSGKTVKDLIPSVDVTPQLYFGLSLSNFSKIYPNTLYPMFQANLLASQLEAINKYLSSASVTLN